MVAVANGHLPQQDTISHSLVDYHIPSGVSNPQWSITSQCICYLLPNPFRQAFPEPLLLHIEVLQFM